LTNIITNWLVSKIKTNYKNILQCLLYIKKSFIIYQNKKTDKETDKIGGMINNSIC